MDYLGFHPNDDQRERILTDDVLHRFNAVLTNIFGLQINFSVEYDYDWTVDRVSAGFEEEKPLFRYYPLNNYLELLNSQRAWPKEAFEKTKNAIMEYLVNEENIQN